MLKDNLLWLQEAIEEVRRNTSDAVTHAELTEVLIFISTEILRDL